MARPIALITGGSAGIGLELAKCFAKDGYDLVLASKPPEELEEARLQLMAEHPIHVQTVQSDLALPGAAEGLYQTILEMGLEVQVLVNNAGFGTYGRFQEVPLSREMEMIRLNLLTVFELTRRFAADMVIRNSGKILNVASQSSYTPVPYMATYASTKAFILHYSSAINFELKKSGSAVRVLALCPPATRTNFERVAEMSNRTNLYNGFFSMDAKKVAREGYHAFKKGKQGFVPGRIIRWITHSLNRSLPTDLKMWVVAQNVKERKN